MSTIWSERKGIAQVLGGIYQWCREKIAGEQRILILGPGGTGKTTLSRILTGTYDFLLDADKPYLESVGVESAKIPGSPNVFMVIPPGQQHRREATWSDLLREVADGKFSGIILLSSYGYHSIGELPLAQHKLFKGSKEQFLLDFIAAMREDELRVLTEVAAQMRLNRKKQWLFSLVTKQDLWWNIQDEVERHYREGRYAAGVAKLQQGLDPKQVRYELGFACLRIDNFVTGAKEHLAPNVAGYDQSLQTASLKRLFDRITALKDWELKS